MAKKQASYEYEPDLEEQFLAAAILDLRHGLTTYVYKKYILDKLKQIFNDLEITRNEFYWTVRNKEMVKPKKGRPKKIEVSNNVI